MDPGPILSRTRCVALAISVVLALAGCTGSAVEESAPVPTAVAAQVDAGIDGVRAPSEATGGTLRVAAGVPDSLDPARSYLPWVWNVMRLYVRTLVTYATAPGEAGAVLVPDLATGLGVPTDGARTWTYTLRTGARFEDGSAITSRDVKYGIERSFAPDVITGGPTYVVDLLEDPADLYGGPYTDPTPERLGLGTVETPDDQTVVFRLNRPYADFDAVMALPSSGPVPQAADTGADYGTDPMSSGPYALDTVDPALGVVLTRNPEWDRATDPVRTALPDRVELRTGLSGAARDRLVIAGAVDADLLPSGVQPDTLTRIAKDPELAARADHRSSGTVRMVALPAGVPPMDDVHCRRAVRLAVDRAALVERLGGPDLVEESPSLWPRGLPGYMPPVDVDVDVDGADRNRQQQELAACDRPDGLALTLAAPAEDGPMQLAAALADVLGEAGIQVEVAGVDPATYYSSGVGTPANVAAAGYGLLLVAWSADLQTPATFFPPLVGEISPEGNANYAEVVDPASAALVTAATAGGDPQSASATWRALDARLLDLAAYVPLVEERVTLLAGQRLRNGSVHVAYGSYDLAVAGVR